MRSLQTKSLVTCVMIVAALALNGGAAMAANAPKHVAKTTHVVHSRMAAHRHYARTPQYLDFGQLIAAFFGGAWPANGRLPHYAGTAGDSEPYVDWSNNDTSVAPVDNSAAQAASDAEVQAIQQMNDENALVASMAAAEQENDAANAAALQTEINAGN
jgi:hypothetical protein